MKVRIEEEVFLELSEFYEYNLQRHPSLDKATVIRKEQRLIKALTHLGVFAASNHIETKHEPWRKKGYKDYYSEGFHFGYKIETLPTGEKVVVVYEACHELLFY